MKIASSDIQMSSSSRAFLENAEKPENSTLRAGKRHVWSSKAQDISLSGALSDRFQDRNADKVTLMHYRKASNLKHHMRSDAKKQCSGCLESQSAEGINDQISLMKNLVEKITGRKMNIFNYESLDRGSVNTGAEAPIQSTGDPAQVEQGLGVSFDYRESYTEVQTLTFSAQGTIKTADGQEINFSMSLEMSLEYHQESSLSFSSGDAVQKDPLVINYNGSASELTSAKFSFDLGMDGTQDSVSLLQPGSGLLALGENKDGIVNDDSQLITSGTGDGLSELSAYDVNLNSIKDKNNAVDDRFSAWSKIPPGRDQQSSLQAKSVGAIYLSSISTLFDLKDADNRLKGQIAATGIYAEASGSFKIIQHLNLAV